MSNSLPNIDADFLFSGKAEFIAANPAGNKFRFKLNKAKHDPDGRFDNSASYFVSTIDDVNPIKAFGKWSYVGIYNQTNQSADSPLKRVVLTRKSWYVTDSTQVKIIEWIITLIENGGALPDGYSITHVGKCGRCGRKLTDDESRKRGIGPECNRILNNRVSE